MSNITKTSCPFRRQRGTDVAYCLGPTCAAGTPAGFEDGFQIFTCTRLRNDRIVYRQVVDSWPGDRLVVGEDR